MRALRQTLAQNADWLAVVSMILAFLTPTLIIGNLSEGRFPSAWSVAALASFASGVAIGTFARMHLAVEERLIASAALGLHVTCGIIVVFLAVLPLGVEG